MSLLTVHMRPSSIIAVLKTIFLCAVTKPRESVCGVHREKQETKQGLFHQARGYHALKVSTSRNINAKENTKRKPEEHRDRKQLLAKLYKAIPLGLPKTRSALLVLIVRGLSGISSYILDTCFEVLTARDLVVMVGETVRPSLGTAPIGVTPPD